MARTSCFAFKGKNEDLRAIADRLGVRTVLEGSVRKAGSKLRVTVQLVNASDGCHLWSERFDREMTDVFALQDEIAAAIAARLEVSLLSAQPRRDTRAGPRNVEAYELLLRGRAQLWKRDPAIRNAVEYFERALVLDPGTAETHALLGDALRLLAIYGMAPTADVIPRARAEAELALSIDPNQGEALASLANIASAFDWNWQQSQAYTDRALTVDPLHVRALVEHAFVSTYRHGSTARDREQAFRDFQTAIRLDPLSAWAVALHSLSLASVERHAEAIAEATRAIELDPAAFTGRWALVWALAAAGRDADALDAAEQALLMSGRNPRILAEVAACHWRLGNQEAAEQVFQEITLRAQISYVGWSEQAAIAAAAGRLDEARELVRRGIEARDAFLAFETCPAWGPLRADADGRRMLESVGP